MQQPQSLEDQLFPEKVCPVGVTVADPTVAVNFTGLPNFEGFTEEMQNYVAFRSRNSRKNDLVRNFGSAHAEKSRLLHGITSEMMVTFGSSVSIDAAALEKFRLARM